MTTLKALKCVFAILSGVRLIPLIPLLLLSSNRHIVFADMDRYASVYHLGEPRNLTQRILLFAHLMTWLPEFRNSFYLRTGLLGKLLSIFCPPLSSLKLGRTSIGPGLFILHGDSTHVSAVEIGENCWITQQVVVGYINEVDIPTIGNNVTIHPGAKILGKVKIGDNVTVGANSVVIGDVPSGVTVMGVPAKIIWGKGLSGSAERPPRTLKGEEEWSRNVESAIGKAEQGETRSVAPPIQQRTDYE
jgi:serine O-acetyltransferase